MSAVLAAPALWRSVRVGLTYWWRHGRWPSLADPRLFTEWVQWRKLNDRCPHLARLTDKIHSKRVAAEALGADMLVPTLWSGRELPSAPPGPLPLMVKANHGCGQYVAVRTPADWERARRESRNWLGKPYGRWLDEWHYGLATPILLVEPLLGRSAGFPVDYKIYVFGGRAEIIQVHEGRGLDHRWSQLDRNWSPLSAARTSLKQPASFATMLDAAERLGRGHDFLRVDFYEIGGRPMFGEFCLFPGSGLDPFDPPMLDQWLGDLWRMARAGSPVRVASRVRDQALEAQAAG